MAGQERQLALLSLFAVVLSLAADLVTATADSDTVRPQWNDNGSSGDFKNVLYLIVDDLRPQMTVYNQSTMKTPNFQRLAEKGLVFERAYCQVAVCVPSRNSFMSGRRPDTTKVWSGMAHSFRDTGPDWITMPEHFKKHGFIALGGGKTYHPNSPPNWDEPKSWSQDLPYFSFKGSKCPNGTLQQEAHIGESGQVTGIDTWCALDESEYPYSYHYDNQLANHTVSVLKYVKEKKEPFFVAAGFRRPHVPWKVPKTFWDMYGDQGDVPTPLHVQRPLNAPDIAFHNQGVFNNTDKRKYLPMPTPMPKAIQQAARRAYFASVSWTDYNVGLVLAALDDLGLANDTLVVLHGDHGYQLGEHDSWHKQTNWELATRVPLIVRAPWKPRSLGRRTYALVELVDMYRTVAELAGTNKPSRDVNGTSFAPLFDSPGMTSSQLSAATGKTGSAAAAGAAFSQYLRCVNNLTAQWADNWCSGHNNRTLMGYSLRTDVWRYTAWMPWQRTAPQVDWARGPDHVELYDHSGDQWLENDFDHFENENVAASASHASVITELHAILREFFSEE
eukprot:scpid62884/ scgid21304/ Iduronate 2-sulfatase; Alpha-L-iduronate sulfate sulfatase